MKFFIAFSAFVAVAYCKPSAPVVAPLVAPVVAPIVAVSAPIQSQYHAQDGFGQYVYGYSNQLSAKNEVKTVDGSTVGAYSYVDPAGKLQTVQYSSDALNGFRVAASNLPVAPALPTVPEVEAPKPVEDTAEVAEAKAKHLAEFEEVKKSAEAALAKAAAVPIVEVKSAILKEITPVVVAKSEPSAENIKAKSENTISTTAGILTPTVISPAIAAPILTAPAVALRTSLPSTQYITVPTIHGYSYGINTIHGAYLTQQPTILTYASPLLQAPFVQVQPQALPEAASDASGVVIEAKKNEEVKPAEKAENSQ